MATNDKKALHLQKEILNKKFKKKISAGYDPEDVDIFFDEVIAKIKDIDAEYSQLSEENEELKKINQNLIDEKNAKDTFIIALKAENEELKKDGYASYRTSERISELKNSISDVGKLTKEIEEIKGLLLKK